MSNLYNNQPDKDHDPQSNTPPLPDFDRDPDDDTSLETGVRTSEADAADLHHFLNRQRSSTETDQPTDADFDYKSSPAEADFSHFSLEPLEDETPPKAEESRWQTAWSIVREVGETIILTLIIFFLIQTVVRNFRVVGTSMVNNLHDGQYLIIDKVSYNPLLTKYLGMGGPQRGDVIVFEPPNNPNEDYVKRIIGLPGEEVNVINGQVFINGVKLDEPFEPVPGTYTMPSPIVVPPGDVFVLGDNRNNSNDSHNWGPLPIGNIVGRAWVSYWPPDQWGTIPRDIPSEDATLKHFVGQFIPSASANNE
ncbi:MAG: signal peptidase I [Anaerolineae bacterium]|nr:signal peptidase I [Anaerolineae bacterium]